jgi:Holliday junction resolvase RusA-like endonuclease
LIPVSPVPASRPRVPRFGKPYYEGRYKTFRENFGKWLEKVDLPAPLPKPATFALTIRVAVDRPKKPTNTYPRGDVDNYAKSVMDQLQGKGWFADDVQVTSLFVTKGYAEPGAPGHIHIYIERNDLHGH